MKTSIKSILKITGIPVIVASLCCLTPVIIVLSGLGSVSFAASLADTLYGTYKWIFRIVGLMLLILSVIWYLRREKGICTIDEAKRRRNEVLNVVGVALTVGAIGYFVWLYVVVEYAGKWLSIWK
ncbi:MAG: hypothetical protein HYT37_02225 [Candidatus Sungbacteria bacterium]|nr:hypothetical protein [Candidatus Sungbacteria bacterium]